MRKVRVLGVLGGVMLQTGIIASTRYWVGGNGNWTDAATHWAASSGGSAGAGSVPAAGDDIVFDINSGSGTLTVNNNVSIATFTFSANCSNLTVNISAATVNITSPTSGLIMNSGGLGVLQLSGGILNITNTAWINGGTFQLNSGTLSILGDAGSGNEGLLIGGGTVNIAGASITIGDGNNEIVSLSSGNLSLSAGTMDVQTKLMASGGTLTIAGGNLNLGVSSSSTQVYAFYLDGAGLTYNLSGGTVDLKNAASEASTIFYIGSTCTAGTISGGSVKFSAANFNYYMESYGPVGNMEVSTLGKMLTLKSYDLDIRGSLTLNSGILDAGTQDIYVYANWITNSGAFNYNAQTVYFSGTSSQQISGTGSSVFYNLTLFNSSGLSLSPGAGIATTVMHTLTLSKGKITLGNFDLNIGADGVSGEDIAGASSSKYIITNGTGVLRQYNIGNGGAGFRQTVSYPIGITTSYNPLTISMSGTSAVDNFSVRVSQSVLTNGTGGAAYTASVVDRTWEVGEGTAGGSSVKLEANWNAADELPSFSRTNCYVSHYEGGIWSSTGPGASGSSFKIKSGTVTSFSPFAVASNAVLPVELLGLKAVEKNRKVMLSWQTLTETNNKEFTLQRGADGVQFENLLSIAGAGNSQALLNYSASDEKPLEGTSYYRLMQTDFDGTYSYSSVVEVAVSPGLQLNAFPNPAVNTVFVEFNGEANTEALVSIFEANGHSVLEQHFIVEPGKNRLQLNISELPPGAYFLTCTRAGRRTCQRLMIE